MKVTDSTELESCIVTEKLAFSSSKEPDGKGADGKAFSMSSPAEVTKTDPVGDVVNRDQDQETSLAEKSSPQLHSDKRVGK